MRILAESGKGANVHLSTFSENASGQGWITQQLGVSGETIPSFPPSHESSGHREALPVALGQQSQAQGIELDEAGSISLVIGARVILERHMRFRIERVG